MFDLYESKRIVMNGPTKFFKSCYKSGLKERCKDVPSKIRLLWSHNIDAICKT